MATRFIDCARCGYFGEFPLAYALRHMLFHQELQQMRAAEDARRHQQAVQRNAERARNAARRAAAQGKRAKLDAKRSGSGKKSGKN